MHTQQCSLRGRQTNSAIGGVLATAQVIARSAQSAFRQHRCCPSEPERHAAVETAAATQCVRAAHQGVGKPCVLLPLEVHVLPVQHLGRTIPFGCMGKRWRRVRVCVERDRVRQVCVSVAGWGGVRVRPMHYDAASCLPAAEDAVTHMSCVFGCCATAKTQCLLAASQRHQCGTRRSAGRQLLTLPPHLQKLSGAGTGLWSGRWLLLCRSHTEVLQGRAPAPSAGSRCSQSVGGRYRRCCPCFRHQTSHSCSQQHSGGSGKSMSAAGGVKRVVCP